MGQHGDCDYWIELDAAETDSKPPVDSGKPPCLKCQSCRDAGETDPYFQAHVSFLRRTGVIRGS